MLLLQWWVVMFLVLFGVGCVWKWSLVPSIAIFMGQIDTWHLIKLSDLGAPYFQTKLFNTIHAGFMNGAAEDVHWMTTFWSLCQAAAWDFQRDPLQEWYGSVHWPRGMMVADLESIHRSVPLKKFPHEICVSSLFAMCFWGCPILGRNGKCFRNVMHTFYTYIYIYARMLVVTIWWWCSMFHPWFLTLFVWCL